MAWIFLLYSVQVLGRDYWKRRKTLIMKEKYMHEVEKSIVYDHWLLRINDFLEKMIE